MNELNFSARYRFVPLSSVQISDAYCTNAVQKEAAYLMQLDENRLLAGFFRNAGLSTPYVPYGGWESGLIGGHTAGHYLSALSFACSRGDLDDKIKGRLYEKLVHMVDGLALCQAHSKGKAGFLWGAPAVPAGGVEAQFDNVEKNRTDILNEAWVPWYTMHKLLAGLISAYEIGGYEPALAVAMRLGDWVSARASGWDGDTVAQVLSVEYGGMNDCMYDLYRIGGCERHAVAAHIFDEETLFDKLLTEGKDLLKDKHANTMIPKIIGALNRYMTLHGKTVGGSVVDATRYLRVAEAFWRIVVERHTYVTGGNSEWEHFGADYVLDRRRTNCNCETCIVYNMLKLSRALFALTGEARYLDYYDNAFTNSILSSQNPETGMTTYFQPMAGGFFKVFSRPFDKFWCCTGTGMENFSKLGESVFFRGESGLCIGHYLAARYHDRDMTVELEADLPFDEDVTIRIVQAEREFRFTMRIPEWAADEPTLLKNGARCPVGQDGAYLFLSVREGDEIRLHIPASISLKELPDGDALAFRFGGAVLSADLGCEDMQETETGVDVTIPARRKLATERIYFTDLAERLAAPDTFFRREGEAFVLQGGDIPLRFGLHYRRYRERYAIYWRLRQGLRAEDTPEGADLRTPFDSVQPGYGQYESDDLHEMRESCSVAGTAEGSTRAVAPGGYVSYDLAVDPERKNILAVGFLHSDNGRHILITAEGETLFDGFLNDTLGEERYQREFEIPDRLLAHARKKHVKARDYTVLRVQFALSPKTLQKAGFTLANKIVIYCS